MYYKELAEGVRHYKEDEEGVLELCQIMEEVREEGKQEGAIETAKRMIFGGKLTLEEVSMYSGLPLSQVQELAQAATV